MRFVSEGAQSQRIFCVQDKEPNTVSGQAHTHFIHNKAIEWSIRLWSDEDYTTYQLIYQLNCGAQNEGYGRLVVYPVLLKCIGIVELQSACSI